MKKIIKEKKINSGIVKFVLYLSFCFAGWYSSRSAVASVFGAYPSLSYMNNEVTAFLIAGVMPIIIYILAVKFFAYSLKQTPYLPVDEMLYALPFFYIGANLVTGLVSIAYYFVPIVSFWGGIIVPLVSTACFFIWFLAFICKNYVKNYNWKVIVMYFGRMYIFIALFMTAIGLLGDVL